MNKRFKTFFKINVRKYDSIWTHKTFANSIGWHKNCDKIRGYEDGYNDIVKLEPIKIKPKVNAEWYDGEFEDSTHADAIDAVDWFDCKLLPDW